MINLKKMTLIFQWLIFGVVILPFKNGGCSVTNKIVTKIFVDNSVTNLKKRRYYFFGKKIIL